MAQFRRARWLCAALAVAALAGCTATPDSIPDQPATLVVLGDSLSVDPPVNCDGCSSWVAQYASALEASLGRPVEVQDEAKPDSQIHGVFAQLDRESVKVELADATAVVVWIGFNEGPPWNEDTPCATPPGDTAEDQALAVEGYSQECIDATMSLYSGIYADLFAQIAELSPNADSRVALTIYSNWAENPAFAPGRTDAILGKVVSIYDSWNLGLCTAAESSGFTCADAYHAVNGADGLTPATAFVGSDFTHLSQAGHDAIAALLTQ